MIRTAEFDNIVDRGLEALGFRNDGNGTSLTNYFNFMFAEKYNAQATFAQEGFPVNPNIPLSATWEQINATIRPYTMAARVDVDSDGPTKHTDGFSLKMGSLPTFKHEAPFDKKTVREKLLLAQEMGYISQSITNVIMDLMFMASDSLIGGNYNTLLYMKDQIVSNMGKYVLDATNNPLGIPLEVDFGIPTTHIKTSTWYTEDTDGNVTQDAGVTSGTTNPITVLRKVKHDAEDNDFCPTGHWEISKGTKDALVSMKYWRDMYTAAAHTDTTNLALLSAQAVDDDILTYIGRVIGAPIVVKDHKAQVEKWNATTKKVEVTTLKSFVDGVMVYVPDGVIGDVQFSKPLALDMPCAKIGWYDGGRTLLRQTFNSDAMSMLVKSEFTGMVVPNKTQWMYYVTIKG